MILALLLALAPVASAALPPEAAALADAPLEGAARVGHARALLARAGWEEAGIEALRLLVAHPDAGAEARAALAQFLAPLDGRPAWGPVYVDLLASGDCPSRPLVELRRAESIALVTATRGRGLDALDTLAASKDPGFQRALGRAYLRLGEGDRALAAFGRASGQPGQRDGQVLAAIAAGRIDVARELAETGAPPLAAEAIQSGELRARAEALAGNGYTAAAARLLGAATRPADLLRLAEFYRAMGRDSDAAVVLARARKAAAGDAALDEPISRALADAFASTRRYKEALVVLPAVDADRRQQLEAAAKFKAAWESTSKQDDAAALEGAWRSWPGELFIAREWGKRRLAEGRPEEALPALGTVLDIAPTEADTLGVYSVAAHRAGTPSSAARRYLAGAAATSSATDRAKWIKSASVFLMLHAEEQKKRGLVDDAIEAYLASLAIFPAGKGETMGAAGLLWQSAHLEGALALYDARRQATPDDAELVTACVRLNMQLGREEEALRILRGTRSKDKQVALLRVTVENGIRAREARAAERAGDIQGAAALWRQLVETWPREPEFLHGLGDAMAALDQCEEAIEAYREAAALDKKRPWVVLGEANCLVKLGRAEAARARVEEGYPAGIDLTADEERPRVLARAWRWSAETVQAAGLGLEAFAAWREAFTLHPEVWAANGLAGLYLEHDQPEVALAFFEEAQLFDSLAIPPRVGAALALERLGRWDEAIVAANWITAPGPDGTVLVGTEATEARRTVLRRVTVSQAEYERRAGDARGALARVSAVIEAEGPSADLWNVQVAAALDVRECSTAMAAVPQALRADPRSRWALGMALRAGTVCASMQEVFPLLEEADRLAGQGYAAEELRAARMELTLQRAERLVRAGRGAEAAAPIREAEALGPQSPDDWARVGGAWLAASLPAEALRAFDHARAQDIDHIPSIIGIAGALKSQMRLAAAEAHLQVAYDRLADPRVGLQLVQVQIQRGRYQKAEALLADVKTRSLRPEPPPPPPELPPDPLPILPLPSGRVPGPRTWPPVPPQDTQPRWLVDAREAINVDLLRERSVNVIAGGGYFNRPGDAGASALNGWYAPVSVVFPPIGLLRPDVDATVVSIDDGVDSDLGVATSAGLASPPFRRFFATARVGLSPIGFNDVNLLWSGEARYGLLPNLTLGGTVARAPMADSLLSWSGKVDSSRGLYGFVSQIWGSAFLTWNPSAPVDVGLMARAGYTEGYGVEPNPMGELVGWSGLTVGKREVLGFARLGAEGLVQSHARQEDGFDVGQGGYFSPSLFVLATARVDTGYTVRSRRVRLCGSASLGPQYTEGDVTPWFGVGLTGAGKLGAGAALRFSPGFAAGLDARVNATLGGWHQESALLHLTWGLAPATPSTPSQTTVASPGAILLQTSDLCRVE